MKRFVILGALICAPVVAQGFPAETFSSTSDTTAFIGIQMDLTDLQPQLIGGVRYTNTSASNSVTGAKADIAIPLRGTTSFAPTFRLMGLTGNPDLQGEAGIGYNLSTSQPLLAIGAQGSFLNGGANFEMGSTLKPYIGVNSLDGAPRHVVMPAIC